MIKKFLMETLTNMNCEVEMTCPFCGKDHSVWCDERDFDVWRQYGDLVQSRFPYLTPTEREQLISHLCPECQADVFGADEEEIKGTDLILGLDDNGNIIARLP